MIDNCVEATKSGITLGISPLTQDLVAWCELNFVKSSQCFYADKIGYINVLIYWKRDICYSTVTLFIVIIMFFITSDCQGHQISNQNVVW